MSLASGPKKKETMKTVELLHSIDHILIILEVLGSYSISDFDLEDKIR